MTPQRGQAQLWSVCVRARVYARWTQRGAIPSDPLNPPRSFLLSCTDLPPFLLFLTPSSPSLTARDREIERQEQLFDLSPPLCFGHPKRHKHKIISSLKFVGSMRPREAWRGVSSSPLLFSRFSLFLILPRICSQFWWVCVVLRWHAGRGNDFESTACPCQGLDANTITYTHTISERLAEQEL